MYEYYEYFAISVKIYKTFDLFGSKSFTLYSSLLLHLYSNSFSTSSGKQLQILIKILNYLIMSVYK